MSKESGKLDGGVKSNIPQFDTTAGNVITPVQGLFNDAGCGKPATPGAYGSVADGEFPAGEKMPGGNAKAMTAWFGTKNPGGGK